MTPCSVSRSAASLNTYTVSVPPPFLVVLSGTMPRTPSGNASVLSCAAFATRSPAILTLPSPSLSLLPVNLIAAPS